MAPSFVALVLAQTISSTPAPVPDDGPPPPSIVERIGEPTPAPSAAPTARAAASAAPIPTAVPIAAPALAVPAPKPPPAATAAPIPVPAAAPVPAAKPKPSAARASAFGVHVGSYRKRATAEGEARRLGAELALPARVLEADLGAKGVWFRTVVGEVGTAAEASALREQLKKKGIPDGVVQSFPR
jgi:cell division protein FtsN